MSPPHLHHTASPFGSDRFGRLAERFARAFGTPKFIIGQSIVVLVWIALNGIGIAFRWDPYPFILLNLMFSTQAAYAAPLILLAQTRQADRDKVHMDAETTHREEIASEHAALLEADLKLTKQIHALVAKSAAAPPSPPKRKKST